MSMPQRPSGENLLIVSLQKFHTLNLQKMTVINQSDFMGLNRCALSMPILFIHLLYSNSLHMLYSNHLPMLYSNSVHMVFESSSHVIFKSASHVVFKSSSHVVLEPFHMLYLNLLQLTTGPMLSSTGPIGSLRCHISGLYAALRDVSQEWK